MELFALVVLLGAIVGMCALATPLATFVQTGVSIDYTPDADVAAGDVIVIGSIVAVAPVAISAGVKGAVTIKGVVRFPKDTGSGSALDAGTKVYWDPDSEIVTSTADGLKCAGYTVGAAAADDETVDVDLCRA